MDRTKIDNKAEDRAKHPVQPERGLDASGAELIPLPTISAGWPEGVDGGCVALDAAAVLRAKWRSFALRVQGDSMIGANIFDGDIVIGDYTAEARPGAIVVALIDGESALKRLVMRRGKPHLVSENPNNPDLAPLSELVVQGVAHTVVHRLQ